MAKQKNQLKIGIILNYINMAIGTIVPLVYTPIMLRLLGKEEYGLYKLSTGVTSYLSLISMGIGSAISRYMIKAREEKGQEEEEKTLGLFMLIYRVIAAAAFVIGTVLTLCLGVWYGDSLTAQELTKMKIIVFIIVCNTALNFITSPYMSVVSTHERFLFQQIMNICSTSLMPALNLVMLFFGFASIGLAVSSLIWSILGRFIYLYYIRKTLNIRAKYIGVPKHLLKEILLFSFWSFLASVVSHLYNSTDTVMIGAVPNLGTKAVAIYNVGATFSSMVLTLTIGISSLLSPRTNKMVFAGASNSELTGLAIKVGRIQGFIVTLIVTGFIAFGRPFIMLYAGEGYEDAYWVGLLTMIHSVVPLVQSVCLSIITAQNKHRFRSLTYLGIALANVAGTWILLKTPMGIIGAALMTCIAGIIGTWFVMNWYYSKKINLEMKRFWKELMPLYIIPAALCVITLVLSRFVDFYNVIYMIAGILIYSLVYMGLSWKFVLNDYEKGLIITPVNNVISKFKKDKVKEQ